MADHLSVISRSSFVRGRVSGSGNLEIAGRVEGEISVTGDLTIDTTGLVASNVSARRLIVRGAVKGDLAATEAIVLEAGARVVGDVNAPRVAIAEGALVRGHVQTGAATSNKAKTGGFARGAASAPKHEERVAPREHAHQAPHAPAAAKKAPPPPPATHALPRGSVLAGLTGTKAPMKAPPAPVVPVLKKGAKATQKKRG
jgi:cytoskeletal protein CcmA (bactofilin family)